MGGQLGVAGLGVGDALAPGGAVDQVGAAAAGPADDPVEHGDQGDEGQEHGADVEGELEPVAGAAGGGVDEVGVAAGQVDGDVAVGLRRVGVPEELPMTHKNKQRPRTASWSRGVDTLLQ